MPVVLDQGGIWNGLLDPTRKWEVPLMSYGLDPIAGEYNSQHRITSQCDIPSLFEQAYPLY